MSADLPTVWRIRVAAAGTSKNGAHYPLDVLHRCIGAHDGTPVRFNPDRWDHEEMGAGMLIGILDKPYPDALGVEALLHLLPSRKDVAQILQDAWLKVLETGEHTLGFSHVINRPNVSLFQYPGSDERMVWNIKSVDYLDLVDRPAMPWARILGPAEGVKNMFAIVNSEETKLENAEKRVEELKAQAKELVEAEKELDQQLATLHADFGPVKRASGEALLQSVMTGKQNGVTESRGRSVEMMFALDNVHTAIDAAREKRRETIESYWKAEARAMQLKAKAYLLEADELDAKVKVHFDAVTELTGVRSMVANQDPEMGIFKYSRMDELRFEAKQLEVHAGSKSRDQVKNQRGTIRGKGEQELFDALYEDPMELRPRASDVREWIESESKKPAGTQLVTKDKLAGVTVFAIHWRNGKIDVNSEQTAILHTRPAVNGPEIMMDTFSRR